MNIIDFIFTYAIGLIGFSFLIIATWLIINEQNRKNKRKKGGGK